MTRRATCVASVALLALGVLSTSSAQAAYVVTFEEVGSNVVETGSGTINLAGLFPIATVDESASVTPDSGRFLSGDIDDATMYGMLMPPHLPIQFGPGSFTRADITHGGPVGVLTGLGGDTPSIIVPSSYVSGTELSDSSTYGDATLASLGLKPGAYVINWGPDSITIDVVGSPSLPIPEPSTWAMMLIGLAGLCFLGSPARSSSRATPPSLSRVRMSTRGISARSSAFATYWKVQCSAIRIKCVSMHN
jgi:PEP-CTERM motif